MQIGAEVGDDFDFQTENLAVFSERHLGSHRLVAALDRRQEIFAASGDPFDRLAQFEREMAGDDIFTVDRTFAAEAAADIGSDQMNSMLGKADHTGDLGAGAMRSLGRQPNGQVFAEWIGAGDDAARFHRQRHLARAGDMHGEDMIRGGKRFVDVAAVFGQRVTDVAVEILMRQRRAGFERVFGVGHAGQGFVFDDDLMGGVFGLRARLGDHGSHRHADAVHRAAGEHRMRREFSCSAAPATARDSTFASRSLPVTTSSTPGMVLALLVSMETIFACG